MATPWVLSVAGSDITPYTDRDFALTQIAFPRSSTLTFNVDDPTSAVAIALEDEVILSHSGVRVFAGWVRGRGEADSGQSVHRRYKVECQDYTTDLTDDVVTGSDGLRPKGESDSDRIAWLIGTYCTTGITLDSIATLKASMPAQDLRGMNLYEAMVEIAKVKNAFFYVDYEAAKNLTYGKIRSIAAPFGVSDSPDDSGTFAFYDWDVKRDTNDLRTAVYIKGTGVADLFTDSGAVSTFGKTRTKYLSEPTITDSGDLSDRADDYLERAAIAKLSGGFKTMQVGLRAGMSVEVTHTGWSYAAEAFPIAQLDVHPLSTTEIEYTVRVGEPPNDLAELLAKAARSGSGGGGSGGDGEGDCCPPWDGIGSPSSGQEIVQEFVAAGDGSTTAWTTAFPYTSGTLRVFYNTKNVTTTKTEDDNTTGDFSEATAPTGSPLQNVYVSYFVL